MVRAAAIGATVAALATGGWTFASAEPALPPLPELPVPGQTYVTPDSPHGFTETDTRAPGTVETSDALGAPPQGNADALVLNTPDGNAKATFFTTERNGPLSAFLSSSYYAKKDPSSTGAANQFPSFQIEVDANGLAEGGFSTLTFEPVYQQGDNANQTAGTWNKYDTGTGLFCSTRQIGGFEANQTRCDNGGTKTLLQIIEANPDIVVTKTGINQGSGNPGILAAVDLFQVGSTTYNFERKAPLPPVVPEPEEPDCDVPTPHDPGPGTEPPGGEQPGHPKPGNGHPGDGGHPDGAQGGGWGEDPKSHPKPEHPKPEHPKPEHPAGEHPGGGQPGGEHPEGPHGGGHPDGPKPPTCES